MLGYKAALFVPLMKNHRLGNCPAVRHEWADTRADRDFVILIAQLPKLVEAVAPAKASCDRGSTWGGRAVRKAWRALLQAWYLCRIAGARVSISPRPADRGHVYRFTGGRSASRTRRRPVHRACVWAGTSRAAHTIQWIVLDELNGDHNIPSVICSTLRDRIRPSSRHNPYPGQQDVYRAGAAIS